MKNRLKEPKCVSGMFNWCLHGLARFRKEGAVPPDCVLNATKDYQDKSDKIARFLEECLQKPKKEVKINAKYAYQQYAEWCRTSGLGTDSKTHFLQDLRARGLVKTDALDDLGKRCKNLIIIPPGQ